MNAFTFLLDQMETFMKIDRAWQEKSLLCLPPFKVTEDRRQKKKEREKTVDDAEISIIFSHDVLILLALCAWQEIP